MLLALTRQDVILFSMSMLVIVLSFNLLVKVLIYTTFIGLSKFVNNASFRMFYYLEYAYIKPTLLLNERFAIRSTLLSFGLPRHLGPCSAVAFKGDQHKKSENRQL